MAEIPAWVPADKPDRIYLRTPWELKDVVKALPGSRWDPQAKCWHIPASPAAALEMYERLMGHTLKADPTVLQLLREAIGEQDAMRHKDADDEALPEIPGRLPGWLHQKRAYHFAANRRATMLAMDMGTGKSRVTISLLDGWDAQVAVILCPVSVVGVWPNQFATHSERPWHVIVPPGKATVAKRVQFVNKQLAAARAAGKPVAVIVNYEASWRDPMKDLLTGLVPGGVLVLDESHRVKSPSGKASRTASAIAKKAGRVLALTGTPMPHSPMDLYAQARALDEGIFGTSFVKFRARYAVMGGFEGRQILGYQNTEELTRKMAAFSFVVKKSEAGLDLPDVLHVQRHFELESKAARAYATLDGDFILGVGEGTVNPQNALTKLLRLQQVTSGFVRDDEGVDHEVGDEKIRVLRDVLEDIPPQEPKIIFARFKADIVRIRALCDELKLRSGEVSGDVKKGHAEYGLNEHSQMRDDLDVVVLQLQSGGVGIDLTRSAYGIYYSLDFNLGNYEQSLARQDRPGQKQKVTYIHLIARGTKDEVVYEALSQRKNVVEAVIEASRGKRDDNSNEEATAA